MEHTFFPNTFFVILHSSLALMFIYCRYKIYCKSKGKVVPAFALAPCHARHILCLTKHYVMKMYWGVEV